MFFFSSAHKTRTVQPNSQSQAAATATAINMDSIDSQFVQNQTPEWFRILRIKGHEDNASDSVLSNLRLLRHISTVSHCHIALKESGLVEHLVGQVVQVDNAAVLEEVYSDDDDDGEAAANFAIFVVQFKSLVLQILYNFLMVSTMMLDDGLSNEDENAFLLVANTHFMDAVLARNVFRLEQHRLQRKSITGPLCGILAQLADYENGKLIDAILTYGGDGDDGEHKRTSAALALLDGVYIVQDDDDDDDDNDGDFKKKWILPHETDNSTHTIVALFKKYLSRSADQEYGLVGHILDSQFEEGFADVDSRDEVMRMLVMLEIMAAFYQEEQQEKTLDDDPHSMARRMSIGSAVINCCKRLFYKNVQLSNNQSDESEEDRVGVPLVYAEFECLLVGLEIIGDILAQTNQGNDGDAICLRQIQEMFHQSHQIVTLLRDMLAHASEERHLHDEVDHVDHDVFQQSKLIVMFPPHHGGVQLKNSLSEAKEGRSQKRHFGYKRSIMRILANLCFRNETIQDAMREAGIIPLVLNHCKVDPENPILQEWSIVCVRNLCENNKTNSSLISSLEMQGIDRTSLEMMEALKRQK